MKEYIRDGRAPIPESEIVSKRMMLSEANIQNPN